MNRASHPQRLGVLLGALALLVIPAVAATAHAADATGCSGQATSYDGQGVPIDTASAPGEGATADDPLDLLWAGTIEWSGTTEQVLQNGSYTVSVTPQRGGFLVRSAISALSGQLFSGQVTNASGQTQQSGTVVPSDVTGTTRMLTGTYEVEWNVTGEAGACTGTAFVSIIDSPTGSVLWWVSLVLIAMGLGGLLLARPKAVRVKE